MGLIFHSINSTSTMSLFQQTFKQNIFECVLFVFHNLNSKIDELLCRTMAIDWFKSVEKFLQKGFPYNLQATINFGITIIFLRRWATKNLIMFLDSLESSPSGC